MLETISLFAIAEITFFVINYMFKVIDLSDVQVSKPLITIYSILFSATYLALNMFCNKACGAISMNIVNVIMLKLIYKEKMSKTILISLLIYILTMISETVFTLIFIYGLKGIFTIDFVTKNWIGMISSNIIILLTVVYIVNLKIFRIILERITKWYNSKYFIRFVLTATFAFGLVAFFTYQNFTGIHSLVYFLEVNIALVSIFIFVIGYFNQSAKNKHILSDYDKLLEYVKTYEKVVDEKSKSQHEFKNQLILLRSMIKDNDKKTINYINKLLKIEDEHENFVYLNKLKNLPTGGLKGFILYKIEKMVEKEIVPFVDISDTLNNEEAWKVCEDNLQDISRAMGVYLDNAIEASSKSKEKYLLIDAEYTGEEIIFTISNTYTGKIDFDLIGQEGYTTNGKGRGHGLALINDIINKNKMLSQLREINGIYYVQKLIIKQQK